MKVQDAQPTKGEISFCYTKGKGRKLMHDAPHLPMELYSASKAQDKIGWDNMMWGWISINWNQWQSDYLKKVISRKIGIKRESYFIEKLPQIGHDQWMYSNGVVHDIGEEVLLKANG